MKHYSDIADRISQLRNSHSVFERQRIRATLNGGAEGVQAVLAWGNNREMQQSTRDGRTPNGGFSVDLPTANMMASGLERLAQRVGRMPTVKTDMIPTKDTDKARKAAEKRLRILRGWDEVSRFELQFPQIGRWLPGYGFTFHVIRERTIGNQTIPVAELRDPYDVFPGQWGADQQPVDVCVVRQMSLERVKQAYPHVAGSLDMQFAKNRGEHFGGHSVVILGQSSGWEGNAHRPVEVVEYYNDDGTYVCLPEIEAIASFIPNPLSEPAFVLTKRFSFDRLQSQYAHVFGLMAMMAKLNILGLIAAEDSVFRETNIFGNLVGKTYKRGRKAVNQFEPGARVEKPTSDQLQQTWQAVNILERQFRQGANYDVSQDGISPNSFATGAAVKELGGSADDNVREYQTAIKHSIELADRKRFEWEQVLHARETKRIYWFQTDGAYEETYVPEDDIDGNYQSRRIYGAMATFDDNMKVVTGLQLMQAGVLDRRSMMDAMDNNDSDVSLMLERMDEDNVKELLLQALGERAAGQDPAAMMALTEIYTNPSMIRDILTKFFTPEEPEMSPEEQAMMSGMGQPGMPPGMGLPGGAEGIGPPPAVQTMLSQIEAEGGGVMSVGQMR